MEQPMIKPCPECGGQRVYVEAVTSAQGLDKELQFKQPNRPAPLFSRKSNLSPTLALTCLVCGYTAIYATEPANLVPDE